MREAGDERGDSRGLVRMAYVDSAMNKWAYLKSLVRRLFEIVTALLFLPFALIAIIFFFSLVLLVLAPMLVIENYQWKKKLKRQGRYKNKDFSLDQSNEGTLIVDSPTLGWKVKHCWWTPDDIRELSPFPLATPADHERDLQSKSKPRTNCEFERWLYDTYLSNETGSAILLRTRNCERFAEQLSFKVPSLSVMHTWSGFQDIDGVNETSTEEIEGG